MSHRPSAAVIGAVVVLGAAACTPNTPTASAGNTNAFTVESTATDCKVSGNTAQSGPVTFTVNNKGSQVTEFYLLADDGLRIVSEVENIGPGISRDLVLQAKPGSYFTACKPGMVGDGVGKASFTVTDSGKGSTTAADAAPAVDAALAGYRDYVRDQTAILVANTRTFGQAYRNGDAEQARRLYPAVRMSYERIEPVAESFGELDPRLDNRAADLAEGENWTGWHRIEKDLWPSGDPSYVPLDAGSRAKLAAQLAADTDELNTKVASLKLTLDQLANGVIGLMDEVATSKVTGEEETWSHTDLWDFQANLDGAKVLYGGLRDALQAKDKSLTTRLDGDFASLQALLDKYRTSPATAPQLETSFRYYNELTPAQVKELSDKVNALSEPLSKVAATLVH